MLLLMLPFISTKKVATDLKYGKFLKRAKQCNEQIISNKQKI